MHRSLVKVLALASMIALASGSVRAQSVDLELGAGASILKFPDHRFFAERGESAPFARIRDLKTDDGSEAGKFLTGHLGVSFPVEWGAVSAIGGGLRGSMFEVDGTTSRSFVDGGAGERYGWVSFNGSGYGTPDGATLRTVTQRDVDYWTLSPVLTAKVAAPTSINLSIFAGPSFRSLDQDTAVQAKISTQMKLTERLDTDYRGAIVGLEGSRAMGPNWRISASLAFSAYDADTSYAGHYTDSSGEDAIRNRASRDTALGVDFRTAVTRRLWGNFSLQAYAELSHLNFAPQMRYQTVASDPGGDKLRVEGASLTGYGVGLGLKADF